MILGPLFSYHIQNLLLDSDNNIKLADFGLSNVAHDGILFLNIHLYYEINLTRRLLEDVLWLS